MATATLQMTTADTQEQWSIHFGVPGAWLRLIADLGSVTAPDLAARSGKHQRFVQHWLEEQVMAGKLVAYTPLAGRREARYEVIEPMTPQPLYEGTAAFGI